MRNRGNPCENTIIIEGIPPNISWGNESQIIHEIIDQYISLKKLSKIIGHKIVKANADECKEVTGFSIGGVPPVAHIYPPTRIFIDKNFNKFDMIYAAAGHPYVVFGITFDNLCSITKGEISDIVE